jgi:hypothetical protein
MVATPTLLAGLALAPIGVRANHEHDMKPRHGRRTAIPPTVGNSTVFEKRADHTGARCTFYDVGEADVFTASLDR